MHVAITLRRWAPFATRPNHQLRHLYAQLQAGARVNRRTRSSAPVGVEHEVCGPAAALSRVPAGAPRQRRETASAAVTVARPAGAGTMATQQAQTKAVAFMDKVKFFAEGHLKVCACSAPASL